jgi:hypothetical protein
VNESHIREPGPDSQGRVSGTLKDDAQQPQRLRLGNTRRAPQGSYANPIRNAPSLCADMIFGNDRVRKKQSSAIIAADV